MFGTYGVSHRKREDEWTPWSFEPADLSLEIGWSELWDKRDEHVPISTELLQNHVNFFQHWSVE